MSGLHDFGAHVGTALDFDHPKFLHEDFACIAGARDAAEIESAVQDFARATGFDRYGVLTIDDDYSSSESCITTFAVHNTPSEFANVWDDCGLCRMDPVLRHCRQSGTPLVYGQDTYVKAGMGEKWEHQAPFGFAHGVAATLHLPRNQHVVFGVDRSDPLPTNPLELTALVAYTQLFATFVQCAVQNVLGTTSPVQLRRPGRIHLSPREHECLQWAAEGKTAWETGMILSIAEGSVAKILASAIRKLDCASKPQAVVKALRSGLIH